MVDYNPHVGMLSIGQPDMPYTELGDQADYYSALRNSLAATEKNFTRTAKDLNSLFGFVDGLLSTRVIESSTNHVRYEDGTLINFGSLDVGVDRSWQASFKYPFVDNKYSIQASVYSTYRIYTHVVEQQPKYARGMVEPVDYVTTATHEVGIVTGIDTTPEGATVPTYGTITVPDVLVTSDPVNCTVNYLAIGRWK